MSTGRPSPELMEDAIRDFKREAPGRSTNSSSTINAAAATIRRLEEKSFTAPLLEFRGASSWSAELSYELERPCPTCLVEKMQHHFAQKQSSIAPRGLPVLIIRRLERPVDEHRTPDDVCLGNESPVPAVQTHTAVVAHGKVGVWWHHDVVPVDV